MDARKPKRPNPTQDPVLADALERLSAFNMRAFEGSADEVAALLLADIPIGIGDAQEYSSLEKEAHPILDPSSGSGTFIVLLMNALRDDELAKREIYEHWIPELDRDDRRLQSGDVGAIAELALLLRESWELAVGQRAGALASVLDKVNWTSTTVPPHRALQELAQMIVTDYVWAAEQEADTDGPALPTPF